MNPQKFLQQKSLVSRLLVMLVFVLSSCLPAATEIPAPPSATPNPPTATPSAVPTTTSIPTDTATPFVPKATIKIASQSPLSIQYADLGTDISRSAELAVQQLAGPLMELGYKVELVAYDDQNNYGVAAEVAKQIVADPEIACVAGPFTSRVLNQVKEIYHQAGLAFVSPSATAAFATDSGYPEVNRLVGRNDGEGMAGAQFAKAQGLTRVFIISQTSSFSEFIARSFRNEAARQGVTVVGDMSTDATENFEWLIDRVLSKNADLVYFSGSPEQAGNFFREARAAGYNGVLMGPSSLSDPALLEFAGPLLMEGGGAYYTNVVLPASGYSEAADFVEDFKTLYDDMPQLFAAQAYDAAGICMKAIEEVSRSKGGDLPTRAEVATGIRALQNYRGISGVYNFDEYGDPNPAQYFVLQIVSPDPNKWDQNIPVNSFEIAPLP